MPEHGDSQADSLRAMLEELTRKLDTLTDRVASIESRLSSEEPEPPTYLPAPSTIPPPTPIPTAPVVHSKLSDAPIPPVAFSVESLEPATPTPPTPAQPTTNKPWPGPTIVHSRPRKPGPKLSAKSFEWLLGARGLALAGVIIVVFGVALFLKLAYDEGWITAIPPAWRCGGSAIFGALLLSVGEVLRRKINPLASSGVSAAGLAIIYASILAATKLYTLLDAPVAFTLLAATTTVGVLLGSLSSRVMLSLLSLVGAFAVPLLLNTGEPSRVAMPAYLLALLALGLALSARRGGAYAHVRRLAWWGTGLLGTLWLSAMYDTAPTNSLVFVALAWLFTVAELVAAARFLGASRGRLRDTSLHRTGFFSDDEGEIHFDPASLFTPEARWVNSAFGSTIWAVTASAITLRAIRPELDALAPAFFGLASLLIAIGALGLTKAGVKGLWPQHPTARTLLADALILNATMLGVATIATALGGWLQVVAWAAVGLAAVETARRIRFRAAGVFGSLLLAVAAIRLITFDSEQHLHADPVFTALGLAFTAWSPQVLFVAAACALSSWRTARNPERPILGSAALWLTAISMLHDESLGYAVGPAMIVLATLVAWASVPRSLRWLRINAFVLASVGLAITLAYQFSQSDFELSIRIRPIPLIIAAACWAALAALPRSGFHARSACAGIALLCGGLAIARLEATHSPEHALLFASLYAAAAVFVGTRLARWAVLESAVALVFAVTIALVAHVLTIREVILDGPPFAHPTFPPALITVLAALASGVLLRRLPSAPDAPRDWPAFRTSLAAASLALAWLLLFATTSVESVRGAHTMFAEGSARGAVLSIWWSLYAVASVMLGFKLGPPLRWAGLTLLGVVALKVLLIDTVTLNPPARVVAAITVGLIILGASVLYARLVRMTEAPGEPGADEPDPTHPDVG